jgi:allantoate deiminase
VNLSRGVTDVEISEIAPDESSAQSAEVGHSLEKASAARCSAWIEKFAELTNDKVPGLGVSRLGYTALEREAHQLFAEEMRGLGLTVHADAAGNTIAELRDPSVDLGSVRIVGTGSHLDSVPNAGRYDGIAGVIAAMEVARLLVSSDWRPRGSVRFVAFAGEEGARFGQACTGSRLAAGLLNGADLNRLHDSDGISIAQAMQELGMDPDRIGEARWDSREWAAFVEMHIEQGSVLKNAGIDVGVVDLISGSTRLGMTLHGRASHTGGTPMHLRADALTAAAEIVLHAEVLANDEAHRGTRITVGNLEVHPGSITTIPGTCHLQIDIRDVDGDRQRASASALLAEAYKIATRRQVGIEAEYLGDASPVVLPVSVRNEIIAAAQTLQIPYRVMPSGASHDTQMINHVCPSGMIFVPSENFGVSHSPDELTYSEDIARGADLLAASLIRLDNRTAADL